jgi:hypothetical protein
MSILKQSLPPPARPPLHPQVPAFMCPRARWLHSEEQEECPHWARALFDFVLQFVPIIGGLIMIEVIAHR